MEPRKAIQFYGLHQRVFKTLEAETSTDQVALFPGFLSLRSTGSGVVTTKLEKLPTRFLERWA